MSTQKTSPGVVPEGATDLVAETKVCLDPWHGHKDPHVDILRFNFHGHEVVVESERWSLIYNVHVDDHLKQQEISGDQLDAYIQGLQP